MKCIEFVFDTQYVSLFFEISNTFYFAMKFLCQYLLYNN